MNVDFGLPKRRDIKVAKHAPQMGLRDCSASGADRGPSNAGRFARPTTLSVRARHPVKHVLKSRRQRAIVLRCHEQQRIRDGDLRFYALHRLRWILVVILIEDWQIIDAHEFALQFLCRKFEVDRLLAAAAHNYGDFASHSDLLAHQKTNYGLWSASAWETNSSSFTTVSANVGVRRPASAVICHATPLQSPRRKPWSGAGVAKLRGCDRLRRAHPVPRLHRRLQRLAARPIQGKTRCH